MNCKASAADRSFAFATSPPLYHRLRKAYAAKTGGFAATFAPIKARAGKSEGNRVQMKRRFYELATHVIEATGYPVTNPIWKITQPVRSAGTVRVANRSDATGSGISSSPFW